MFFSYTITTSPLGPRPRPDAVHTVRSVEIIVFIRVFWIGRLTKRPFEITTIMIHKRCLQIISISDRESTGEIRAV